VIERFASGAPWESVVGYSRTVRAGELVFVAGCTALDETGALVGEGDAAAQARQAIANVERALRQAGATLADVVQTRIYVTDISRWEEIGRAHGEAFGAIRPVTAMVEVAALIDGRMLVEVEAIAVSARG
jgi:enamine deaminase RidA (YjgF/YER057c/UK114 family)